MGDRELVSSGWIGKVLWGSEKANLTVQRDKVRRALVATLTFPNGEKLDGSAEKGVAAAIDSLDAACEAEARMDWESKALR